MCMPQFYYFNAIMEKQISDTELVSSNMNSSSGRSTEHLKDQSEVQSLKVFWVCDE